MKIFSSLLRLRTALNAAFDRESMGYLFGHIIDVVESLFSLISLVVPFLLSELLIDPTPMART